MPESNVRLGSAFEPAPAEFRGSVRGLLNDFTMALGQQMFFWGRDVLLPDGNLLERLGMEKRASTGLTGTSCYRQDWAGGCIELHGACAGWYPGKETGLPGFLFVRAERRCFTHHESQPVSPGRYEGLSLGSSDSQALCDAARVFAAWLAGYEEEVRTQTGTVHRTQCWHLFRQLERSRPWLRPESARRWIGRFADGVADLPRARRFEQDAAAAPKRSFSSRFTQPRRQPSLSQKR